MEHPIFSALGESCVNWFLGEDASPIERQLLAGLLARTFSLDIDPEVDPIFDWRPFGPGLPEQASNILGALGLEQGNGLGVWRGVVSWFAWAQMPVAGYVADFAFLTGMDRRVIVECDGHDFHERTKEQAAHDRRRDRSMVADGWTVLRYTGSEIFRDPIGCASDVLLHLHRLGLQERAEMELIYSSGRGG